jgi:hypothetical protein
LTFAAGEDGSQRTGCNGSEHHNAPGIVRSFVLYGGKFGAPFRIKLRTRMLLKFAPNCRHCAARDFHILLADLRRRLSSTEATFCPNFAMNCRPLRYRQGDEGPGAEAALSCSRTRLQDFNHGFSQCESAACKIQIAVN